MYKNKEKNFVSIVLYLHNAEQIVENAIRNLYDDFNAVFESFEIICVDDCSNDQTNQVIRNVAKDFENCSLTVMHLSYYSGIEQAMTAGIDYAIGDFVFEVDDVTLPSFDIFLKLYYKLLEGYDIVAVSPQNKKLTLSNMYYHIFNKYSSSDQEIHSEFGRIISRRALNRVRGMSKTVPYRKFTYATAGLKYATISYELRNYNKSGMNLKMRKDLAINTLVMFTNIAYKFSMMMIYLMLSVTIATLIYTVVLYFETTPVAGWTTTMLLLSTGFSGIFILFAVVIKYLSIILDLVFKENTTVIEQIEKITK